MIIWIKRLNDYGMSNRLIVLLFFIALVSVVVETISIGIFLPIFELVNQQGIERVSSTGSTGTGMVDYIRIFTGFIGLKFNIETLLILSFTLFLSSKVLLYFSSYVQLYYSGFIIKSMKDRLLRMYLGAESTYYDTINIGDFTNSSSVELSSAVGGAILPIKFIITIMSSMGSVALLFILSPELTFVTLCIVGVGTVIPARWVKTATKVGRKSSRYSSIVTSFLLDRLQSPRLVRLSNTAHAEEESYYALTEKQRNLSLIIHLIKARISLSLEPIIIGISLLMFYVALEYLEMNINSVLLYMAVMIRIVPIISNILIQKQSLNRSIGPINKIDQLLVNMEKSANKRKENLLNKDQICRINKVDELKLKNVNFYYNDYERNVLSDINYTFKKSTLTAIVGPSGGGKTTFVDIVSGYRRPTFGDLFINDINANEYGSEALISSISYVPQSPQIFDGITVYEHISYGMKHSTERDVINASKLSGAYGFIKNMPQGFDTVLIGGSSGLSGGQKQRLDLSRALLRKSPILIMDEPTGNLDLISEKNLMLSIKNIREATENIVIIIAHRIHTIMDADQIIVLEDGEISGIGTHTELLLNNSWYQKAVKELQ